MMTETKKDHLLMNSRSDKIFMSELKIAISAITLVALVFLALVVLDSGAQSNATEATDLEISFSDGVLTISSEMGGTMKNWTAEDLDADSGGRPWKAYAGTQALESNRVTKVIIGDNITTIGDFAFKDFKYLAEVQYGVKCISIGHSAFDTCVALTTFYIGSNMTLLYPDSFFGCDALKTFTTHPKNQKYYAEDGVILELTNGVATKVFLCPIAYEGLDSTGVYCPPNTVSSFGEYSFYKVVGTSAHRFVGILFTSTVTTIGAHAFEGCQYLSSLSLVDSITSIGGAAFKDCTRIVNLVLPGSLDNSKKPSDAIFEGCSSLKSVTVNWKMSSNASSTLDMTGMFGKSISTKHYTWHSCPTHTDILSCKADPEDSTSADVTVDINDVELVFGDLYVVSGTVGLLNSNNPGTYVYYDVAKTGNYAVLSITGTHDLQTGYPNGYPDGGYGPATLVLQGGESDPNDENYRQSGVIAFKGGWNQSVKIKSPYLQFPIYSCQSMSSYEFYGHSVKVVYVPSTYNANNSASFTQGTTLQRVILDKDSSLITENKHTFAPDGNLVFVTQEQVVSLPAEQLGGNGVMREGHMSYLNLGYGMDFYQGPMIRTLASDSKLNVMALPESVTKIGTECLRDTTLKLLSLPSHLSLQDNWYADVAFWSPTYLSIQGEKSTDIWQNNMGKNKDVTYELFGQYWTGKKYVQYEYIDMDDGSKHTQYTLQIGHFYIKSQGTTVTWDWFYGDITGTSSTGLKYFIRSTDTDKNEYLLLIRAPDRTGTLQIPDDFIANLSLNGKSVEEAAEIKGKITQIYIEDGVKSIGARAFDGMDKVKIITTPGTLTKIGEFAFRGCSSMPEFIINQNVSDMNINAFDGCDALKWIYINSTTLRSEYNESYASRLDPQQLERYIAQMSGNANWVSKDGMIYSRDMTKLVFCPSGISGSITVDPLCKTIGSRAFAKDDISKSNISMVELNNVELIETEAFKKSAIVVIDTANVTRIMESAFEGCSSISFIKLGSRLGEGLSASIPAIGASAFKDCTGIKVLLIDSSENLLQFGDHSFPIKVGETKWYEGGMVPFEYSDDTKPLYISETHYPFVSGNYYTLGEASDGFASCGIDVKWRLDSETGCLLIVYTSPASPGANSGKMNDYERNGDVNNAPWKDDINNVQYIVIGNGVKYLGKYAFQNMQALSFTVPSTVTSIGEGSLKNTSGFSSLDLTSVTSIGDVSLNASKVKNIAISEKLQSIGQKVFADTVAEISYEGEVITPRNLNDVPVVNIDVLKSFLSSTTSTFGNGAELEFDFEIEDKLTVSGSKVLDMNGHLITYSEDSVDPVSPFTNTVTLKDESHERRYFSLTMVRSGVLYRPVWTISADENDYTAYSLGGGFLINEDALSYKMDKTEFVYNLKKAQITLSKAVFNYAEGVAQEPTVTKVVLDGLELHEMSPIPYVISKYVNNIGPGDAYARVISIYDGDMYQDVGFIIRNTGPVAIRFVSTETSINTTLANMEEALLLPQATPVDGQVCVGWYLKDIYGNYTDFVGYQGQYYVPRSDTILYAKYVDDGFDISRAVKLDGLNVTEEEAASMMRVYGQDRTSIDGSAQIVIIPNEGYTLADPYLSNGNIWSVGNNVFQIGDVTESTTITIPLLTGIDSFKITLVKTGEGTVTGTTVIKSGDSGYVFVKPDQGYKTGSVTTTAGKSNNYQIGDGVYLITPESDVTITVNFDKQTATDTGTAPRMNVYAEKSSVANTLRAFVESPDSKQFTRAGTVKVIATVSEQVDLYDKNGQPIKDKDGKNVTITKYSNATATDTIASGQGTISKDVTVSTDKTIVSMYIQFTYVVDDKGTDDPDDDVTLTASSDFVLV